jgi:diguanylate cyclase (GGDEF)-like protein
MSELHHKNPGKNPLLNGNFVYKITTIEELKEKPGFPFYGEAETADFDRKTRPIFGKIFQEIADAKKLGPEAVEDEIGNLAFKYRENWRSILRLFNGKKSEALNAKDETELAELRKAIKNDLEKETRRMFDKFFREIADAKKLNPEDAKAEKEKLEQKYREDIESIPRFAEKDIKTALAVRNMRSYAKRDKVARGPEEEIWQLRKELAEAKRHAITDVLSGLYNRRHFYQRIEEEFARAKRKSDYKFSVLILDIDMFKNINDTLGHQAGDEAIRKIGEIIMKGRPTDIRARYGGEEFAVILPETDNKGAMIAAEKLREEIGSRLKPHMEEMFGEEAKNIMGTVSVGVTTFDNQTKAEDIIGEADKALYRAKHGGRNQVVNAKETKPELRIIKGGKEEFGPVEKAA